MNEGKIEQLVDKWFERHSTLTKDNYSLLKEFCGMLFDVPQKEAGEVTHIGRKKIQHKVMPVSSMGERVAIQNSVPIHKNIIADVRSQCNSPDFDAKKILRYWYPNLSEQSVVRYAWAYKRHLDLPMGRGRVRSARPVVMLGTPLASCGKNKIFSNVAKELLIALKNGTSPKEALRLFFPKAKSSSIQTYLCLYKRYFYGTGDLERPVKKQPELAFTKIPSPHTPPTDTYVYDKINDTYILNREVDRVMTALPKVRYGYRPTAEVIADEMDMSCHRVNIILDTLLAENKVGISGDDTEKKTYYKKV